MGQSGMDGGDGEGQWVAAVHASWAELIHEPDHVHGCRNRINALERSGGVTSSTGDGDTKRHVSAVIGPVFSPMLPHSRYGSTCSRDDGPHAVECVLPNHVLRTGAVLLGGLEQHADVGVRIQ